MAVTIILAPDPIALTRGGRMRFQFQGNGRVQSVGTPARTRLQFSGPIADATALTLQWNGKKETIVFRTNPTLANEFPAGDGSIGYARDVLAPYFASYFPFRADFESHASDFGTYRAIVLTALRSGPAYNVSRVNTGVSPFTVDNFLAGADPIIRTRYSTYVELWLQRLGTSGNQPTDFDLIKDDIIDTDEAGLSEFDAGDLLHSYLQADLPDFLQNHAAQGVQSGRKYFIAYGEAYGSPVRPTRITTGDTYQAYVGGVDFEHRAGNGFMLEPFLQAITVQSDRALRLGGELRYILPYESQWLTFINTRTTTPSAVLRVQLLFADNTSLTLVNLVPAFTFGIGQKWTIGVGPLQLRLYDHVPAGTTIQEYSVRLMVASADPVANDFLSRSYRYVLGYQKERYVRHFAYINSLGCLDTLTTFGKGSRELERVSKQAERVLPASYNLTDAQYVDFDITLQQQTEVTTGFRSEFELKGWNDFYRSALRYEVVGQADGSVRAIQIGVLSKTIKQSKDGDTQFAHSFQYAQLHRDEFYTPDDDTDPLPPYGLVVAGDPVISFSNPTIVRSVDDTVPSAARSITDNDVQSLRQLTGEGLHSQQGYLKQATTDGLYYRQDQQIDYQTDLTNTPTNRDEAGLLDVLTADETKALVTLDNALTGNPRSTQSPVLTSTGQYTTQSLPGEERIDKGIRHLGPDGTTVLSAEGHSAKGTRYIDVLGKRVAEFASNLIELTSDRLEAKLTHVFVRTLNIVDALVYKDATPPVGFYVPVANAKDNGADVQVRAKELIYNEDAFASIRKSDWQQFLGITQTIPGDERPVLEVLCGPVDTDPGTGTGTGTPPNPPIRITPDMIGVEQVHGLNTAGENLFPLLLAGDNRPDVAMQLSFPTVNTFRIDYPSHIQSGYDGGKLLLSKLA